MENEKKPRYVKIEDPPFLDVTGTGPFRGVIEKVEIAKIVSDALDATVDPPKRAARVKEPKTRAIEVFPKSLQPVMREAAEDPYANQGVRMMMERVDDFDSPAAAFLTGIGIDPVARKMIDEALDQAWADKRENSKLPALAGEVVVGGGLHAAIYCAVRVAMGFPKPIVLEAGRVGGAFAVSSDASFFLNSRNRPGGTGIPGSDSGALNVIPGSLIQPSDLGGAEYQSNDALAWVIRTSLAMHGSVFVGARAKRLLRGNRNNILSLESGESFAAKRVIFATGLGTPKMVRDTDETSSQILTFGQFMKRMDEPFPLRGIDRVAVIGGGDSGKTAIEGLIGQGPGRAFSVASLDWPQFIDWYGAPYTTREEWFNCVRTRYKQIGAALPDQNGERPYRILPKGRAQSIYDGYKCAYVDETPYDCIIVCTGFEGRSYGRLSSNSADQRVGGRRVGKRIQGLDEVYVVGPAAELEVSPREQPILRGIGENETAIFRYAQRTALLASKLPEVKE